MTWDSKIINYIKKNRVSTTEVADCLGKKGALKGVKALNKGHFKVGKIKWVYAYNNSNWSVHEQVRDTKEGDIVFIEAFNCEDRAIIGELVTKYIILYCSAEAIICNTNFRDANDLLKENYPIWGTGFNPEGCFNVKNNEDLDEQLLRNHISLYDGAIAVCDDTGVVIIPKENFNEKFYNKLVDIEKQEDIWFDCLDHKKWNTYDIVCLKKYNK
ncbi:hypothetical protein [Clostridium sp. AUH-JLR23]|uniref:RraA family protein n=1 Tax=Clostridium sp. AUH-JLR23 TaxID=1505062 RepID=UPI0035637964